MTQPIQGVVAHSQMGSDLTSGSGRTDGQGYKFHAQVFQTFPPTNNPPIEIYMTPPGGPYPQEPTYRWIPVGKSVAVYVDFSGVDLIITALTHGSEAGNRTLRTEMAVIPGVWHIIGNEAQKEGGAGAFIPSGGGGGGEGGVTKEEVQAIVDAAVADIVSKFGGNSIRGGIQEKVEDGLNKLFGPPDPQDPRVAQFQDRYFSYVKNASANPLANVLGGQDAWGQARRAELVAIVEEGVQGAK